MYLGLLDVSLFHPGHARVVISTSQQLLLGGRDIP
jgi:hypothetical protein